MDEIMTKIKAILRTYVVDRMFLHRNHIETNRTPDPMDTINPGQGPKHKAPIAVLEGDEINPERHLFPTFVNLSLAGVTLTSTPVG